MARAVKVNIESEMVEVKLMGIFDMETVFMHKDLLRERSEYFRKLIDHTIAGDKGPLVIKPKLKARPFKTFARWIYGQPMWDPQDRIEFDDYKILDVLAAIHDFSFDARRHTAMWDIECVNACLEAIKQVLSQTMETLHDPISCIESVLMEHGDLPGRGIILKHLVHSECADDGRTKRWLDEYCEEENHDAGFVQQVCLEFAGKACGQSDLHTPIAFIPVPKKKASAKRKKSWEDESD